MKRFLIPVILILLSCQQPTIPTVQESIAEPKTIIEEEGMERIFRMNPIPDALGYIFNNGIIKGIKTETDRQNFLQITPNADIDGILTNLKLDDFFTKDGKMYFSVTDRWMDGETEMTSERYFEQTGVSVTEIEIMPDKPAISGMTIGEFGPFTFEIHTWETIEYNKLKFTESEAIISVAKSFDSAVLTNKGILFSQIEQLSRIPGLWYMGNEQPGGPIWVSEYVRIWTK